MMKALDLEAGVKGHIYTCKRLTGHDFQAVFSFQTPRTNIKEDMMTHIPPKNVLPWQQLLPDTSQNLISSRCSWATYPENFVKIHAWV